jgi:hypothetical protein
LSEAELIDMYNRGIALKDSLGNPMHGHHYKQQYHRELGAFMVEIPAPAHFISNPIQHPLGTSGGLSKAQRNDWKKLKPKFNSERARTELLKRGLSLE